jgi:hypothetical protein
MKASKFLKKAFFSVRCFTAHSCKTALHCQSVGLADLGQAATIALRGLILLALGGIDATKSNQDS